MSASGSAKSRMERILRLQEEIDQIKGDIREIYAEEKADGGDKTAMGAAISYIRKRTKDKDAFDEREALASVYINVFEASGTGLATHTHAGDASQSQAEVKGVDRQARARQRTSEAMDDNKAFSKELLEAGLISPEAHAENIAISDGMARKYGAGVIDPETGEITEQEQPETAPQSVPADTRSFTSLAAREADESAATHSPSTAVAAVEPEADTPSPPPASGEVSDADVPAFLKKDHPAPADKPFCLKLKDGHCRIGFATDALCTFCNEARMQASTSA